MKYIIGIKRFYEAPTEWMDKIAIKDGIQEQSRGSRYLFIECLEHIAQELKKEMPYLAIEEVLDRKPM